MALLVALPGRAGEAIPPAPAPAIQHRDLTFDQYTPLAASREVARRDDQVSRNSLEEACAFRLVVPRVPHLGHEPVDARALEAALEALDRPPAFDGARVARCNARVEVELAARLAEAEAALAKGDRAGARARLKAIDARYGGLAAPASLALDEKVSAPE